MNYLKRILTIALCSVLLVCAIPQFSIRSQASSTATYALYETLLSLSGYLATKGYSIIHDSSLPSIPSVRELQSWTEQEQEDLLLDIAYELNTYGSSVGFTNLGDEIIRAFRLVSIRGFLQLSQGARIAFDNWIYSATSGGSVELGSISGSISDYYNEAGFYYVLGSGVGANNRYVSMSCESLAIGYSNETVDSTGGITFLLPSSINDWYFDAARNVYTYPFIVNSSDRYYYSVTVSYGGHSYDVVYSSVVLDFPAINSDIFVTFNPKLGSVKNNISHLFQLYYGGSYDEVVTGSLVSSQIEDTSDSDLLTSSNTISSEGVLEGDTTIYFPDSETLADTIDGYNQGTLTLQDLLDVLGINQVASDATVQEKEDALSVVVTPTDDYLWFTKTQWGADSLEETRKASASTRAEEDSYADSIANTLNGGSDPEPDDDGKSRGKGLLALLLLGLGIWNTPIIAGDGTPDSGGTDDGSTDGSGDTSGYLQESIAGMAIAGNLVNDFFSAAGGSDGYGLAYTVGASFVIFSVIIGAANYFGALFSGSDTKQNIKSSGKHSRSQSPSPKSKKGG